MEKLRRMTIEGLARAGRRDEALLLLDVLPSEAGGAGGTAIPPDLANLRAKLLAQQGRYDEAEVAWKEILADVPDDADAKCGLAEIEKIKGSRARRYILTVLRYAPRLAVPVLAVLLLALIGGRMCNVRREIQETQAERFASLTRQVDDSCADVMARVAGVQSNSEARLRELRASTTDMLDGMLATNAAATETLSTVLREGIGSLASAGENRDAFLKKLDQAQAAAAGRVGALSGELKACTARLREQADTKAGEDVRRAEQVDAKLSELAALRKAIDQLAKDTENLRKEVAVSEQKRRENAELLARAAKVADSNNAAIKQLAEKRNMVLDKLNGWLDAQHSARSARSGGDGNTAGGSDGLHPGVTTRSDEHL